jgi:hypothetical protein
MVGGLTFARVMNEAGAGKGNRSGKPRWICSETFHFRSCIFLFRCDDSSKHRVWWAVEGGRGTNWLRTKEKLL